MILQETLERLPTVKIILLEPFVLEGRVTKEEMERIPHHLIDIKEPNESFSCADYQLLAKNIIDDILKI